MPIKRSKMSEAADGRKTVKVTFTPEVPNPAAQADVEVIFQVEESDDIHPNGEPYALIPLSCTTTDTREHYALSKPQQREVFQAALSTLADAM